MSSITTFDAITKPYPAGRGAESGSPAVDTFAARIEVGTTTVLLGSSGCGKTTLLRTVNRMVEPSSGRIFIDDEDVVTRDAVALHRSIDYVIRNTGLLSHRCAIDSITLVPCLQGTDRHDARCRAPELTDMLGLSRDLAGRHPHQLFGDQAQWVGIARALATDPEVLLMDEPLGAIDPLVCRDLRRKMARTQTELRKTIIFVTHSVDEALALGDEIILLYEGTQVVQRGDGPQLLADPVDDFVARLLGLDDAARQLQLTDVVESRIVLDRAGRAVRRLVDEPSSEAKKRA